MTEFKSGWIVILISIVLTACATAPVTYDELNAVDTTDFNQLIKMRQPTSRSKAAKQAANRARLEGLREVAVSLGAQGALAKRSQSINETLEKNHGYLDQVFNFEVLMLDHQVLPPILVEGRRSLDKSDETTIRLADQSFRIVQQARFATAPPHWRNYLILTYTKPDLPDFNLLPRDCYEDEQEVWAQGINDGWKQGSRQATDIFNENLSRLKRDYEGMLLYHKLVNENMITPPFVAKTELGVTGGGDELTINDRFKRITALPALNPNSSEWKPAVAMPITSIGKTTLAPPKAMKILPKMKPAFNDEVPVEETLECEVEP